MELITRPSRSAAVVPNQGDEILQNAINSFRTALTPEQLAEFSNIQSVPDTDAVLVFTAELDLRRQSQKGKSIASRLFPVLQAVHSFIGVIDTYVSSNPTIAALVWGSVKITIQIMLNAASYYEAFAELFMNLSTVCPRFEQYQALFPTSTRLQVALCNFNASIIRCCQRVIQMPKTSSGWTSPLNPLSPSFWQSFQQSFEPNLKELRDYSKNVKEEIRLAQTESEHRNRELQKLEMAEAEKSRGSLSRFMSRTRTQFDSMHRSQLVRDEEIERERKQKLLDSLSSHDYMKPFKQARQKRYPQSARWIFDANGFRIWVERQTSPLLWCSGKMGSGKTILATSVIDFLLTERSRVKGTVTFFFSRFDDSESLKAEDILRAITRQMINIPDISGHTKVALEDIQNANGNVLDRVTQLLKLLLAKKRQPTWMVIDGIDEWPRDERRKLIKTLSSILTVGPVVKVFVTSRDYPDYMAEEAFPSLHRVSMNCLEAQEGMAQLVSQAVQKCLDAEELLVNDKSLIAEIQQTLTRHADGMILWVTLVLRDLCIQPNNEMIREAISLRNLPKSLAEVFNRALERIISEGKEGITRAILPWIVAAKQPLSLAQLEECCLIQVLQEYTMKDRYVNGIYLVDTWFQGLVEVDHETKTVHFVHSSVQKFFLTAMTDSALKGFYVNMEEADRHIGEVIVTYLNFNDFNKTLDRRRPALPPISPQAIYRQALGNEFGWRNYILRGRGTRTADIDGTIAICTQPSQATLQETMVMEHPFLSYASTHWLLHSSKFNPKDCQVWHIWKEMLINGHELTTSPVSEGSHRAIDEAFIGWAVSTGHSSFFHLLATSSDIVGIGDMLYKATECDTVGDLRALIKDGVPFTENKHGYPLLNAIEARQDGVVGFLLASGADPNYEKDDQPPLELGIHSERIEIIKLLLAFGANVNMKNPAGLTPIAIACSLINPRVDIVELLFEAGAAIEAGESYKLFEKAVERKSADLAKLLVEQGVSVNARQYVGGITPLGLAATAGLFEIMHILLDAGAQVVSLEELLSWIPRNLRNGKEYEEISSRSWK